MTVHNSSIPVICTDHLVRDFAGPSRTRIQAVADINLAVPEGSIYGFLGPNGAGKTTTIRMLLGLLRPTGGAVRLFGRPLERATLAQVGALVESASFYPHLTGRENLRLIAGLRRLPEREVERVLKVVDLTAAADRLVKQYSLGMGQRLGLAIALLGQPRLLILDEPTNGLDPAGIHEMRALIRSLPEQYGATVFLSSHLLSEVEQLASHIGIVQAGKLVFQGPAADLHAQFSETALLMTSEPRQACDALLHLGWRAELDAQPESHGCLKVPASGEPDLALIVQQLVQAGIKVYHASLERPSLEDIFLKMTTPELESRNA
jgi:ABC-2 type transport system ATP-binding protein